MHISPGTSVDFTPSDIYNSRVLYSMNKREDIQKRKDALIHKTFIKALHVLVVFGLPAFIAVFLGAWLNANTGIAPYGRVITLSLAFVISWALIIRMYKKMAADFKSLQEEEDRLDEEGKYKEA